MKRAFTAALIAMLVAACGSNSSSSNPTTPSPTPSPAPSPSPAPAAAQLSLSASPAALLLSGSSVTITPAVSGAPAPDSVSLACGNGQTIALGGQRTGTCTYPDKGTYVATVTAATSNGFNTTAQTRISVEPDPLTITLTAREVSHDATGTEV